MPFNLNQIENGRALPGAVVYAPNGSTDPVGPALDYLALAGKTVLASLTGSVGSYTKQEIHLVRGVRFVEARGRDLVLGEKLQPTQGLLFPRYDVEIDCRFLNVDEIPAGWLAAIWEAAELSAAGQPLGDYVELRDNVKVDQTGKSLRTEYFEGGKSNRREYPVVDGLMRPFLRPLGRMVRG